MSELEQIRESINSIDEQMAQLFQKRMEMSRQVAAFKRERGLSIRDAERERELIERNRAFVTDPVLLLNFHDGSNRLCGFYAMSLACPAPIRAGC